MGFQKAREEGLKNNQKEYKKQQEKAAAEKRERFQKARLEGLKNNQKEYKKQQKENEKKIISASQKRGNGQERAEKNKENREKSEKRLKIYSKNFWKGTEKISNGIDKVTNVVTGGIAKGIDNGVKWSKNKYGKIKNTKFGKAVGEK